MDLNQLTIPSTDLSKSVPFYEQLGLTLIVSKFPDYVRFELPFGNATLSLQRVERLVQPTGFIVYFECVDLDERVAALKAKGIVFDTEPEDQPWLWRQAYLKDPDGNVLCLFRAGINRRNPPWRVPRSGA